ncbi:MAG: hypothetical protein ACOYOL_08540 [Chthoniobacterales bacterium]
MNQKVATIALVLAAVAVLLVFLLLPSPPPPAKATVPRQASAAAAAAITSADPGSAITATSSGPLGLASAPAPVVAWEDRLDQLLTAETDNATTVRGLVSSMLQLPPEAQEQYAAHAVNLCGDEQFGLLGEIYLNAQTPQAVTETIFSDLLNRPDTIKLPLLAKTLRNAAHPMAGGAEEILRTYIALEPGTIPPNGWDQAVDAYLKQQSSP